MPAEWTNEIRRNRIFSLPLSSLPTFVSLMQFGELGTNNIRINTESCWCRCLGPAFEWLLHSLLLLSLLLLPLRMCSSLTLPLLKVVKGQPRGQDVVAACSQVEPTRRGSHLATLRLNLRLQPSRFPLAGGRLVQLASSLFTLPASPAACCARQKFAVQRMFVMWLVRSSDVTSGSARAAIRHHFVFAPCSSQSDIPTRAFVLYLQPSRNNQNPPYILTRASSILV